MPCCGSKTTAVQSTTNQRAIPPERSEVRYRIDVKATNQPGNGIQGQVYLKIVGDNGKETKNLLLIDQPAPTDSQFHFDIAANDVGQPARLFLFYDRKNPKWNIECIEVSVNDSSLRFLPENESMQDETYSWEFVPSRREMTRYQIQFGVKDSEEQRQTNAIQGTAANERNARVYVQIAGMNGKTPKIYIDPEMKCDISAVDVGEIENVTMAVESEGNMKDVCLEVLQIIQAGREYKYAVNKKLGAFGREEIQLIPLTQSPDATLVVTDSFYSIFIRTGDASTTELEKLIQFSMQGSKGSLEKKLLKDYARDKGKSLFQRGNTDQFDIPNDDIGKIESITIGFDGNQTSTVWLLESIDVRYKEIDDHFQTDSWLSNRLGSDFSWLCVKSEPKMNYQVIVETGPTDLTANVSLCIYGTDGTTPVLALKSTELRFPSNSRLEFNLSANDVGKIIKINIGHDGKDQEWFLKTVEIIKNDEHYSFTANRWLSQERDNRQTYLDLPADSTIRAESTAMNLTKYTIIVATAAQIDAGTDSGVLLTIHGKDKELKNIVLRQTKQGEEAQFNPGSVNIFEVDLEDIGPIKKINIGHDGKGLQPSWHLETVEIHKGDEVFRFTADTVLDLSMQYTDLIPIPPKGPPSRPMTPLIKPVEDVVYQIFVRAIPNRQGPIPENAHLYLILMSSDGKKSEKIPLKRDPKSNQIHQTYQSKDLGQISEVILAQAKNEHRISWHVQSVSIRYKDQEMNFLVQRSIEQGTRHELRSSVADGHSEVDYEIKTTTGNESYLGNLTLHLYGERGSLVIPLTSPKSDRVPFQAHAVDEFSHREKNVGRVRKIIIGHEGTNRENPLVLKRIQIIKGRAIYDFNATIRVDHPEKKLILYPEAQRKEDYVETQLRQLRETLRNQSSKRRRPLPRPHQPYVYNDLEPYYDTATVEKAIYEPLEATAGYYTRVTALRIVEPWEAYGMDYGVSYQLLKPQGARSRSAKRSSKVSRAGMMILPPLSLPFGGQVTYVNSARLNDATAERSSGSSSGQKRPVSGKGSTNEHP